MSAEEIKSHLLATLDSLGSPPIVLVLPLAPVHPRSSTCRWRRSEVKKLIEEETVRLGGVSEPHRL